MLGILEEVHKLHDLKFSFLTAGYILKVYLKKKALISNFSSLRTDKTLLVLTRNYEMVMELEHSSLMSHKPSDNLEEIKMRYCIV